MLGDVFLRSYYAIHDMDNHKLGLTPHTTSLVGKIEKWKPLPPTKVPGSNS